MEIENPSEKRKRTKRNRGIEWLILLSLVAVGVSLYFVSENFPRIKTYQCSIDGKIFMVPAKEDSTPDNPNAPSAMQIEVLSKLYPRQAEFSVEDIVKVKKNMKAEDLGRASCLNNTLKDFLLWSGIACVFILCPLYLFVGSII